MEIPHARIPGRAVYSDDAATLEETIGNAIRAGASLRGADLGGADLSKFLFRPWDLDGARLDGARLNLDCRCQVFEVIRQAAGDDVGRLKWAGLVLGLRKWCWPNFDAAGGSDPDYLWCLEQLRGRVADGVSPPAELARARP